MASGASGRSKQIDEDKLISSYTITENGLQGSGLAKMLDIWVPHELEDLHLQKQICTCDLLLKRKKG